MNTERMIGGKYRVVRQLGAGGMGQVLLAIHAQLDQKVAIKLLRPDLAKEPIAIERFLREARAIARIENDHVVRVSDVASDENGAPYIVMEYLEGEDLGQRLDKRGPLPIGEAIDFVLQACVAIAEAHRVGVVHRDLKPGNLFVARRPNGSTILKVVDFGISKLVSNAARPEASLTTTSRLMGSPFYMSPEQLRGDVDVDGRSDIWALGMILFELMTGEGPFDAPTIPQLCMQIMEAPPRRASQVRIDVPAGIDDVIHRALAKDIGQRFPDVAAFAAALAPFAPEASRGVAATARAALSRPPTPPLVMPVALPPAERAPEGPRVTSNAWNTGNGQAPRRRATFYIAIAAAIAGLAAGSIGIVRLVTRDTRAVASVSPAEAMPPPPPPSATTPPSSASAAPPTAAPSASVAPSARPALMKPRATAPTAPTPPGGGNDLGGEFGGRK